MKGGCDNQDIQHVWEKFDMLTESFLAALKSETSS